VFYTESGESVLPPECALLVLSSTLATPSSFVLNHLLQELLQTAPNSERKESAVFLSFLNGFENLAVGVKKLVILLSYSGLISRELTLVKQNNKVDSLLLMDSQVFSIRIPNQVDLLPRLLSL
jgi:hypothetical protein